MGLKRIVAAQITSKLGLINENLKKHRRIVKAHRENEAHLVVFPELSLTGYLLKDLITEMAMSKEELVEAFSSFGRGRPLEVVIGWLERSAGYRYYNALAHLRINQAGEAALLHNHRKLNLPTYGMFEEERYYSKGNRLRAYDSPLLGRVGMLICEDLWHAANPLLLSLDGDHLEGVNAILVASASPARGVAGAQSEPENATIWHGLALHTAITANALVVVCQKVGVEDGFVFTGGSEILAPGGKMIAKARAFEEQTLQADIDLEALFQHQRTLVPDGAPDDFDRILRELGRMKRDYLEGGEG